MEVPGSYNYQQQQAQLDQQPAWAKPQPVNSPTQGVSNMLSALAGGPGGLPLNQMFSALFSKPPPPYDPSLVTNTAATNPYGVGPQLGSASAGAVY